MSVSGSRRRRIDGGAWVALTAAILRGVPRLDGALCIGRHGAFDGDGRDGPRTRAALDLCARCPAHTACAEWLADMAVSPRPRGVVAGRWRGDQQ